MIIIIIIVVVVVGLDIDIGIRQEEKAHGPVVVLPWGSEGVDAGGEGELQATIRYHPEVDLGTCGEEEV